MSNHVRRVRSDDLVKPFPDRRWDFYKTDRQVNEGDQADPSAGGGSDGSIFPVSPIQGFTYSVGDSSHPAAVQLFNPGGSGVDLWVYELALSFVTHATSAVCFGKRTVSPTTLVTPYAAALQRLDEQDATAIKAKMYGWTTSTGITIITESDGQFPFVDGIEGNAGVRPYAIREAGQFPIIIEPGSALEFTADTNSADTKIRMWALFDEMVRAA